MSPPRTEIAEALRLLGPCSMAEIAAVIDRPADTLYRHMAALKKAGLAREAGLRKRGRNAEQVFEMAAEDFVPDFSKTSKEGANRAVHRAASTLLKAMDRTVRDAAAARALEARPEGRNVSMNYELGWLTPAKYQEVRSLIRQLKALMDESKKSRDGRLYMTLAVACPVVRKRTARRAQPVEEPRASKATKPKVPRRNALASKGRSP